MKKINSIVVLSLASVFIAVGLTACGAVGGDFLDVPDSLKITKFPHKTAYIEGEQFNPSGLEIKYKERHTETGQTREKTLRFDDSGGSLMGFSIDGRVIPGAFTNTGGYTMGGVSGNGQVYVQVQKSGTASFPITVTRLAHGDFTAMLHGTYTYGTHGFTSYYAGGSLAINGYSGAGGDITIPSEIDGRTVVAIGDSNFPNNPPVFSNKQITSVIFPDSVSSFANRSFQNNPLISITIGVNSNNVFWASRQKEFSFADIFPANWAFWNNYRGPGTYTRTDADSTIWIKQED